MLEKDGFVSIHHNDLQKLAVEIFKGFQAVSPQLMSEIFIFKVKVPYSLMEVPQFETRPIRIGYFGGQF